MHIAARYEELGIAGFRVAEPERRPGRLRRKILRQFVSLQLLGMNAEGKQHRKPARRIGPIDIDHDSDAVAHRHRDILVADDPCVLRRPLIIGRRLVARGEKLLGGAGVVVFHAELRSDLPELVAADHDAHQ